MKTTKCKIPTAKGLSKRFSLLEAERRFRRACEQIVQLNYKMGDLEHRYKRAKTEGRRNFRYSLRLRLAAVEGLRNMYYDYAHQKAQSVADLRQELFGEEVQIVTDEMADSTLEY